VGTGEGAAIEAILAEIPEIIEKWNKSSPEEKKLPV
jgi:hypothetical protein